MSRFERCFKEVSDHNFLIKWTDLAQVSECRSRHSRNSFRKVKTDIW